MREKVQLSQEACEMSQARRNQEFRIMSVLTAAYLHRYASEDTVPVFVRALRYSCRVVPLSGCYDWHLIQRSRRPNLLGLTMQEVHGEKKLPKRGLES